MSKRLTTAEVLDRAADLVEPEGAWTQNAYARGVTGKEVRSKKAARCFCAVGAIDAADNSPIGDESNWEAIRLLAWVATGDRYGSVAMWNDDACTTQSDVVSALRKAATVARELS